MTGGEHEIRCFCELPHDAPIDDRMQTAIKVFWNSIGGMLGKFV